MIKVLVYERCKSNKIYGESKRTINFSRIRDCS